MRVETDGGSRACVVFSHFFRREQDTAARAHVSWRASAVGFAKEVVDSEDGEGGHTRVFVDDTLRTAFLVFDRVRVDDMSHMDALLRCLVLLFSCRNEIFESVKNRKGKA